MDKESIYKTVQKALDKTPLILVGSGGSAPYGLPNMQQLGEHLKESLNHKYSGDYNWNQFIDSLDNGADLESALIDKNLDDKIIDDIRVETWKLISETDLKIFEDVVFTKKELSIGKLINKFYQSHPRCVNIITTNYDRVIEYACDSLGLPIYNGFNGMYTKRFKHDFKKAQSVNIVKVHGSLDSFRDVHGETVGIPLLKELKPGLAPEIITPGLSKYQSVLKGSIREMLHETDQLIDAATAFLCIGYGFNDEHIQEKILTKIHQGSPIVIITKKLSDKASHLIHEKAKHSVIIEEGEEPNTTSFIIDGNLKKMSGTYWSIDGLMQILD